MTAGAVTKQKLGPGPYICAGLSYIPLVGVIFGIAAIALGLSSKKKGAGLAAAIGAGGIGFTIAIYSALFYFGTIQRGGVFDSLRTEMAGDLITRLVDTIEVYKLQNGKYPDSLAILHQSLPKDSLVFVFDPTAAQIGGQPRLFHYQIIDQDHYYLLGVGADTEPFTADDILPKVDIKPESKIGLVIRDAKNAP